MHRDHPRHRTGVVTLVAAFAMLGLSGCTVLTTTSAPVTSSAPLTSSGAASSDGDRATDSAAAGAVTVVAAGDIGTSAADSKPTADLIADLHPDYVLTLGDNAYSKGSAESYQEKYDPTWGAFKDITKPVPGNHDYDTKGASGYFGYFGQDLDNQPYYAWDAGAWRMYALNCEIECEAGSAQETWLKQDLAAHPDQPALAYVHRPRFTCSTSHRPTDELTAIWDDLEAAGGQLMLAGHNHSYERFALLDGEGRPDPDGLRQFVVGTGGAALNPLKTECENRQAQNDTDKGVLKLELLPDAYTWQFVNVPGAGLRQRASRLSPLL
jgi:acid phosphatase type 7